MQNFCYATLMVVETLQLRTTALVAYSSGLLQTRAL